MDGYSFIEAVVEFSKDELTKDMNDSHRLWFQFKRVKRHADSNNKNERNIFSLKSTSIERKHNSPTYIRYDIDYSKDHGEKKRLVSVEVFAQSDFPSTEEAKPMEESAYVDEDGNVTQEGDEDIDEISMGTSSERRGSADKYIAYADPDNIEEFLRVSGLQLNAENTIFFLMTFPYYEHEWDIFGFLLDCVFGVDEEGSDEYEDMSDSEN